MDLVSTAFLDTETTGLGSGVGTYVFLIGVGYVRDKVFCVRQFFLRHPAEELPVLAGLAEFLSSFAAVISFNGKAFDWPLLENRYIYQRSRQRRQTDQADGTQKNGSRRGDRPRTREAEPQHEPLSAAPERSESGVGDDMHLVLHPGDPIHLDLLHLARRFWQARLESCALSALERHILGVSRTQDDVPGWLIPQVYFDYLRHGHVQPLRRVLYHNLHDILSLAALTIHMDRIMADPWCGLLRHPLDFYSMGKLCESAGETTRALRCYDEALREHSLPPGRERDTLVRIGRIEKRQGNWQASVAIWRRLVDDLELGALACVELAKYYEHVERNHEQALTFTLQALQLGKHPGVRRPETGQAELEHRKRRLVSRLT